MSYTIQKRHDHYIVVMPAEQAIQVTNLLSTLNWLFPDGINMELADTPGYDPWEYLTPQQILSAYEAMRDNLEENWLGHNEKEDE